jgi:hypothetical protein
MMDIRLVIILGFAAVILTLIYKFESPPKNRKKITGRGGDFAE